MHLYTTITISTPAVLLPIPYPTTTALHYYPYSYTTTSTYLPHRVAHPHRSTPVCSTHMPADPQTHSGAPSPAAAGTAADSLSPLPSTQKGNIMKYKY